MTTWNPVSSGFPEPYGTRMANPVNLELAKFSYHFSVKGKEGGLFSLSFEFVPKAGDGEAALKLGFKMLEAFLDQNLLKMPGWSFRKTPAFSDSSWTTSIGYDYDGEWRGNRLPQPFRALIFLPWFLVEPFLPSSFRWNLKSLSARLSGEWTKATKQANLELRLQLTHALNCQMLEQVLALPGITVSPQAAETLDRLNRLLKVSAKNLLESWIDGRG